MPDVIKYRQLDNNIRLTPKTDFVFKTSTTGDLYWSYDLFNLRRDQYGSGRYVGISVGKGQYLTASVDSTNDKFRLILKDKYSSNNLNVLDINSWTNAQLYYDVSKVVTFLGKPYISENDDGRYIIFNQLKEDSFNYIVIFNIDTWTEKYSIKISDFNWSVNFTFNGEKIYYTSRNDFIYETDLTLSYQQSVRDFEDNILQAYKIYGVTNNALMYKDLSSGSVIRFDTVNLVRTFWGASGFPNYNGVFINGQLNSYLLMSNDSNGLWIRNINDASKTFFLNSYIDGIGFIGTGETGLVPVLVLNINETTEELSFIMLFVRTESGTPYLAIVRFIIRFGVDADTSIFEVFFGVDIGLPNNIDIIANSFETSCQSYAPYTFYDYGLQTQFNNSILSKWKKQQLKRRLKNDEQK